MSIESLNDDPGAASADDARAILANFLATSQTAQAAAKSLRSGAEAAIRFADVEGEWRIRRDATGISLEQGKALDPDFELRLPPAAVHSVCARHDADIGDLGVTFFEHIVAKDPGRRIHVTVHSGLIKLTHRGWLGLLTRGGPKVILWLANRGLRGPGAVATALGRFQR